MSTCRMKPRARTSEPAPPSIRGLSMVVMAILLLASLSWGKGLSVNWGAAEAPIYDENGVEGGQVLVDGSLVQLILDKDNTGIDPPDADGNPSGGEVLIDCSSVGEGSFFKGKFSKNFLTGLLEPGMQVYVRAWNGPSPMYSTHFGNSRLMVIPEEISVTLDATLEGPWATLDVFTGLSEVMARASVHVFDLMHGFPNPFAEMTSIPFSVPGSSISRKKVKISLDIYDTSGRLIRGLLHDDRYPGYYVMVWDGKTEDGEEVPSGVYMCRLEIAERSRTRKLLLLR